MEGWGGKSADHQQISGYNDEWEDIQIKCSVFPLTHGNNYYMSLYTSNVPWETCLTVTPLCVLATKCVWLHSFDHFLMCAYWLNIKYSVKKVDLKKAAG